MKKAIMKRLLKSMQSKSDEKVDISYPTKWQYKVIGNGEESIKDSIDKLLIDREYKIEKSNVSKSGKYISLNLDVLVYDDDDRVSIFNFLKDIDRVKMIL